MRAFPYRDETRTTRLGAAALSAPSRRFARRKWLR
jgi:hypothetical protein